VLGRCICFVLSKDYAVQILIYYLNKYSFTKWNRIGTRLLLQVFGTGKFSNVECIIHYLGDHDSLYFLLQEQETKS